MAMKDGVRDLICAKTPLSYDEIKSLVAKNTRTLAYPNECVIAVIWKECSFRPDATNPTSTAKGLLQMTNPAVDTVNANTPIGVHFEYADMFDPSKAIQCGTYYLQICYKLAGGADKAAGLNRFGGKPNYAQDVLTAEACLRALPSGGDPMKCLKGIHPLLSQKTEAADSLQVYTLFAKDLGGGALDISRWIDLPAQGDVMVQMDLSLRRISPFETSGDVSFYTPLTEVSRFTFQLAATTGESATIAFNPLRLPSRFLISIRGFIFPILEFEPLSVSTAIIWKPFDVGH